MLSLSTWAVDDGDGPLHEWAELFDRYRVHYGEHPAAEAVHLWAGDMARSGQLRLHSARLGDRLVGLATSHQVPASLRLGHFWMLRDLYVAPADRGAGTGLALVSHVRRAALDAGALRLSLQTEPGNSSALRLYRRAGFVTAPDIETLTLELPG
jgi:GNAT superfamily N-acetyltransferase